jgi:hypothetical protein
VAAASSDGARISRPTVLSAGQARSEPERE